MPTPSLVNSREEVASLVAQQQGDGSLKDSWRKAGKGEEGYCTDNGVLIHVKDTNLGRELVRVVVPKQRRLHLLDLGHRGLVAGYFSHNKMRPALTEHFTSPGIKQHIKEYCTSCPECPKKKAVVPESAHHYYTNHSGAISENGSGPSRKDA